MKTGTFDENDVVSEGATRDETTGSENDVRRRAGEPDAPGPADSPAATPISSEDSCADSRELPDEIRALLTEFGRALHREAMYPAGHPALEGSAAKLREFVAPALHDRDEISINVERDQLAVDGMETEPQNPILASLADQLHRHQISALNLRRAVEAEEISELLDALNSDPVGRTAPLRDRAWRHVRITFFPYEQLRLDTEDASDLPAGEQTNVWLAFAQAALDDDSIDVDESMDTDRLAERISERCPDDEYCRLVTEHLLAVQQTVAREPETDSILASLASDVVTTLDPQALRQLLEQVGGSEARRQLLSTAARSLSVEAVLKLLLEAKRFEERETPDALWLVFSKLAHRSNRGEEGERDEASGLIREQVLELVTTWKTEEFMPADYSMEIAAVAGEEGLTATRQDPGSRTAVKPVRVLQMAVETEVPGESIRRAFDLLIRDNSLHAVLDVLDGADSGNTAAQLLKVLISESEFLSSSLSEEAPDFSLIDRMLAVVGVQATPIMLDAISEVESRANRGKLFQQLVGLGPGIGPDVVARLDDKRWYVRRNLLSLLDDVGQPDGFSAVPFLDDEHEAVRRAAIKLVLKQPEDRERAIEAAIASEDSRSVILGLLAAKQGCPDGLMNRIADLALSESLAQELRLHAVRAIAGVRSDVVLEALISIARGERRWILLRRPGPPTPLELEALAALRTHWADDARATKVLSSRRRDVGTQAASGP